MDEQRKRIARTLDYPYEAPNGSFLFENGKPSEDPDRIDGIINAPDRKRILAIGSNRSPEQLARKFNKSDKCGIAAVAATCNIPGRRIRSRAGLDSVRIHDLRRSFASRALALGEGLPMIGKLLGHTQVQTTARYAHLARDTVKASAARIGDSIERDLAVETD